VIKIMLIAAFGGIRVSRRWFHDDQVVCFCEVREDDYGRVPVTVKSQVRARSAAGD